MIVALTPVLIVSSILAVHQRRINMKLGFQKTIFFGAMILGSGLFLSGCVTTGMQRSSNTGTTMRAVEDDYQQAIVQVSDTNASLEVLVDRNPVDEKKALGKYSVNVKKTKEAEKRLFAHSDKMRTQQKEYFEEWRKQGNAYVNPQIQALSEQRREDLSGSFVKISEASVGVKGSFKSYMSDLEEIKTYLSTDLTPKGVEAITLVVHKAVEDGERLKESIYPVVAAIDEARVEMAQGGNQQ